jgi:predicted N-acetyltransferase YhbS
MFQVKPMITDDFPFATKLANTMNWDMATEDFQFMRSLEPQGCFVAYDDAKRVGIATCIGYSKVGWFGNLIVKEEYRSKGAGSLLVRHAIDYLHGKGVETIGLYAYPQLARFYGNLGFRQNEDFSVLQVQALDFSVTETLPSVGAQDIAAIVELDRRFFGGDRRRLLESIIREEGNLSYFVSAGKGVVGYVAATVYEKSAWVGPLICKEGNLDTAVSLLRAAFGKLRGKTVYAVLPKKESALANVLFRIGFREDFFVSRMFLGRAVAKNCIYMAESLERG